MKTRTFIGLTLLCFTLSILVSCKKSSDSAATNEPNEPQPSVWENGVLPGLFSVSESTRIQFSQGNLQYKPSAGIWRFAANQYNYIGEANSNISASYEGWIDLFGAGTGNNPNNASVNNDDYGNFVDWGCNKISNGGNTANYWRTLNENEMVYLVYNRVTPSGIRIAKAKINGINGLIILPDNWATEYYDLNDYNDNDMPFSSNIISLSDWQEKLEANGAVFMPAAGGRNGNTILYVNEVGYYQTSTYSESDYVINLCVTNNSAGIGRNFKCLGQCVRLVKNAQ